MLLASSLALVVVVLAGGALPLLFEHQDRWLRLLGAFSTGVFLATVFLDLLPEVASMQPASHSLHAASEGHAASLWTYCLGGVLLACVAEVALPWSSSALGSHGSPVILATVAGLGLHSFTGGVGLGVALGLPQTYVALLLAMLTHKLAEAFSLASVLLMGGLGRRRTLFVMGGYAGLAPLGILTGHLGLSRLEGWSLSALLALSIGTLLFACMSELLPGAFHERRDGWLKLGCLALGIATIALSHGSGA